ncbi:MAG: FtsQ-type POTRA domain-containing protein [Byssovorax sp.]
MSERLPENRKLAPKGADPKGNARPKADKPLAAASSVARRKVIEAPVDPIIEEDSPLPGPATTTVRPPPGKKKAPTLRERGGKALRAAQLALGVVVVIAASVAVAWGARRYVMSSPRFAIRTVLVDGEKKRSATAVASLAGVEVGKNIFALDLALAGQMVKQDPWIERAEVTRKLPSTVTISVIEREASAVAVIGEDLYLATRDGEIFKKLGEDDPSDLPLVTGLAADQVVRDRPGVVLAIKRVLDVAADLDRVGVAKRYTLQELHLEKDGSLVVTIGKEGIFLHLGQPPYRDKIEQANRVLFEVARRKAQPQVIFLDNDAHPERVVVRMR